MKRIEQYYVIKASVEKVWKALVDQKRINAWSGGSAKMSAEVGSDFSLWGGDVHGKNLEVVPNKILKQEWYGGDWKEPSLVTFILTSKNPQETNLKLLQENIPDEELEDIEDGWKRYYCGEIKKFLES